LIQNYELFDQGATTFTVSGILVTPQDGKVYHTSDKHAFKAGTATSEEHYLYYDSNGDGVFYETVYVLAPDPTVDEDGTNIYTVESIGYNYDGKIEFKPYEYIDASNQERIAPTFTGNNVKFAGLAGMYYSYNFERLEHNELLFPDSFDGLQPRDSIFEVHKLVGDEAEQHFYPHLFYETKQQSYNSAWNIFSARMGLDIAEQVGMTLAATGISMAVGAAADALSLGTLGSVLRPIVYFAVYSTLSKYFMDVKHHEQVTQQRAREFYDEDRLGEQPKALNERTSADQDWKESMAAAVEGHPGGYYTTAVGQSEKTGETYTADLIVNPRNEERTLGFWERAGYFISPSDGMLEYDYSNLNYFMISSELASLNDRPYTRFNSKFTEPEYKTELVPSYSGYMGLGGYGMSFTPTSYREVTTELPNLYNDYRFNTLGYVEYAASKETDGELDRVIPMFGPEGTPQYRLINADSEQYRSILPENALYRPIVVSEDRYSALKEQDLVDAELILTVQSERTQNTKGITFPEITAEERQYYAAKLPITEHEFEYPIETILVDVYCDGSIIYQEIHLPAESYSQEGNMLYFDEPFEDVVSAQSEEISTFIASIDDGEVYYDLKLHFPIIVSADPSNTQYQQ
jgi:hypothetical protein